MKITLKIAFRNGVQMKELSLGQVMVIGRNSKCDCRLFDDKVSGQHCRFYLKKDRLEITDLESKNGLYLNGIRIEQSEMFIGDEVRLGDTVVTLEEQKVDAEAADLLTFPGHFKDRMNYELKADFTGARIQNQLSNKRLSVIPKIRMNESHVREVDLRKKIQSRIKLSKQEIRSRFKFQAFLATIFDSTALFLILSIPVFLISQLVPGTATKEQKLYALVTLMGLGGSTFFLVNFKVSKFTVGEKLSGIKERYLNQ
jgi:pSer/pThr/pTyr-binding forkhead associated (FHA) protein